MSSQHANSVLTELTTHHALMRTHNTRPHVHSLNTHYHCSHFSTTDRHMLAYRPPFSNKAFRMNGTTVPLVSALLSASPLPPLPTLLAPHPLAARLTSNYHKPVSLSFLE